MATSEQLSRSEQLVRYERNRQRRMAEMVEKTELKLAGLYREVGRYKMSEVINKPCAANTELPRLVLAKKLGAWDAD